ncbi:hypothetical protein FKM82_028871 [Ascaphus truei]
MASKITKIINKHRGILQGDKTVEAILPKHPQIVFKKADNLKLAPSCPLNVDKEHNTTWLKELNGFFTCN